MADSRMLATIGAFRGVRERNLEDFPDVEDSLEHLYDEVQHRPSKREGDGWPNPESNQN